MIINTDDLLSQLYAKYPNKLPTTTTTTDELNLLIGNQQVIKTIEDIIARKEYEDNKNNNRTKR